MTSAQRARGRGLSFGSPSLRGLAPFCAGGGVGIVNGVGQTPPGLDPFEDRFGQYGLYPLEALLDNTCNHYFVQQNLYAVILERRYGVCLRTMWLCQIHPSFPSYRVVPVPDLRSCAGMILDAYRGSRGPCSARASERGRLSRAPEAAALG